MAKTLIGNVKGKDGRGIASIDKTGTTGSVDTYTITYTDGTSSTYTVNNSDSISLQRQIVPSAAVESSTTASQSYTAGDYVVVNGVLRKVKSAIAEGNTIGDSNSTATTVTGELATLGDSVSPVKTYTGTQVISFSSERHVLFEVSEQIALFGRALDKEKGDFIGVMNGDEAASAVKPTATLRDGRAIVVLDQQLTGPVRINYVVVLGV